MGDLKLVEKPQPVVLAPHDFCNIKASVKVASTENGIIFGNIGKNYRGLFFILLLGTNINFVFSVYDIGGAIGDRNVVVLDDIRIDIMDYIMPAVCNDSEFRQMWTEFEWENKVNVSQCLLHLNNLI